MEEFLLHQFFDGASRVVVRTPEGDLPAAFEANGEK